MGRHRTRFQRFIDLKPKAFWIFKGLRKAAPRLTSGVHFYPELDRPSTHKLEILEEHVHPSAAATAAYREAFDFLSEHNIDTMRPKENFREPLAALRVTALVDDCIVPGHTLVPTDAETGKGVSLTGFSTSNWNFAHPTVSLRTIRRSGAVFVVPNYRNYYHILVDILFPLYHALTTYRNRLPSGLTVVTPKKFTPVVANGIAIMRQWVPDLEHVALSPFETVRAERLLYARTHSPNSEFTFAFPETVAQVREAFFRHFGMDRALLPEGQKVFIKRGRTRLRRVESEERLAEILARNGFRVFAPEWSNFGEQIAHSASAGFIAGIHGAGLTNIVWGGPETTLCEIMPENARKRTYLHIAAEVGAGYVPMLGSLEKEQLAFDIDPERLAMKILEASEQSSRAPFRTIP